MLALAERDRERGAIIPGGLERGGDRRSVFFGILTQYFLGLTREAAVLRLDIWSEATRNPAIAAMNDSAEAEARAWLIETFETLATSSDCNSTALYGLIRSFMKGVIGDQALTTGFDPTTAIAHVLQLIEAGLSGCLQASFETSGKPHR